MTMQKFSSSQADSHADVAPAVSVIVPVFNMARWLRPALDSALAQSLREIEILCIDDGSTDDSPHILAEYAKRDPRVRVITQENRGVGPARNAGILAARGEFVAFLDPDDLFPSDDTLEALCVWAKEKRVRVCGGSICSLANDGKRYFPDASWGYGSEQAFPRDGFMRFADWQYDYGFYRYIFERKMLVENGIFFPDYIRYQDPIFCVRALEAAGTFYALRRTTYVFRDWHTPDWTDPRRVRDQLRGLRDLLKFSRERGYAKLHWLQLHRLFGEFKDRIVATVKRERENLEVGGGLVRFKAESLTLKEAPHGGSGVSPRSSDAGTLAEEKDSVIALLKEIEGLIDIPLARRYKADTPYYSADSELIHFDIKVSVIIPVYNVEKYLRQCLDSVVGQTLKEIEIICVDDGSTDSSPQILEEYAARDPRIKVLHQENSGVAAARNLALNYVHGEYVGFVDPDDYIAPKMYQRLVEQARNPLFEIVECGAEVEDAGTADAGFLAGQRKSFDFDAWEMHGNNAELVWGYRSCAVIWNKIYKTAFIRTNAVQFDDRIRKGSDMVFRWFILPWCRHYKRFPEKLYHYVVGRPDSIQTQKSPERDWTTYLNCISDIYDYWKQNSWLRSGGNNLFWRLWNLAKWKHLYCFGEDSPKRFWNDVKGIHDIFEAELKEGFGKGAMPGIGFDPKSWEMIKRVSDGLPPHHRTEPPNTLARTIQDWWKKAEKTNLELEVPRTYNEKIQWLKCYDLVPAKTPLSDKIAVRRWVEEKLGESCTVPILGIWNSFDEIDFGLLPQKFVLKTNHGSGYNLVVKDKDTLDKADAKKKFDDWLSRKFEYRAGFEMQYAGIPPKIFAEPFLDIEESSAYDWAVFCANGEPKFIRVVFGGAHSEDHGTRVFYDLKWKKLPFTELRDYVPEREEACPNNLDWLVSSARTLCKDFVHVWVDFFRLRDGKFLFAEMTFTRASGRMVVFPKEYNRWIGDQLKLPTENPPVRETGIDKNSGRNPRIVVSLTSFPARIKTVHLTVSSLLQQSLKPDALILWLADSQFPRKEAELPRELLALREYGLEIRWTKDIGPYKKLVPALKAFPNEIIVTADDDLIYVRPWLELLYRDYQKNPKVIPAHRITKIRFDGIERISAVPGGYDYYPTPSCLNKLTCGAGALFPPGCFHKDILDEEKFKMLAPTSDDIWFWLMAVLNGYDAHVVKNNIARLFYIPGAQEVGLCKTNDVGGENRPFLVHLKNVLRAYPELVPMLEKEQSKQDELMNIFCDDLPKTENPERIVRAESAPAVPAKKKIYPAFLVRLGALFILNKSARKRWRERHMDLTPKDGIDVNAHPELRRDGALKRFGVRLATLFIFSKKKRKAFRAKHLNLTPRDGVDIKTLSSKELARLREAKRSKSAFWRVFDALVPVTRGKIVHTERHLRRAAEEQTRILLDELRRSREETMLFREEMNRRFSALDREAAGARERSAALERKLAETQAALSRKADALHDEAMLKLLAAKHAAESASARASENADALDSLSETFEKVSAQARTSLSALAESVPASEKRVLDAVEGTKSVAEKQKQPIDRILKVAEDLVWTSVFNSSIASCNWLRDKSFSPGRWAVGYPFLYVLFRVLNDGKPTSILETGLGQSTRMISQYAAAHAGTTHTVVEHDEAWARFFAKSFVLPENTRIVPLELTKVRYGDDAEVVAYKDFSKTFRGRKFDFISIDGPFGFMAKIYARADILPLIPECLNESFVILIDDYNRKGERATVAELTRILRERGIEFCEATYSGMKQLHIIASPDKKFLCSL